MAKKPNRSMGQIGTSQKMIETDLEDKFASTERLAHGDSSHRAQKETKQPAGRISPQLSCTISPEDMAFLNQLTIDLSAKAGKPLKISQTLRSIIALAKTNEKDITVSE
jgi:hypothetical protein